ncbi:MAG: circularly permuted type 2 ATP-grasp protein [Armatimonadetes bacterium]|nr:circularly permuted type 2 ATP-grasp protein [Anaerolineae bacterium]
MVALQASPGATPMISQMIDDYHNLLTDDLAHQAHDFMMSHLEERHLKFGNVPVCRTLRPQFYDPKAWEYLQRRTALVLRAFAKAHAACMSSPTLRAKLDLEPFEEEMLHVDADAKIHMPWSSSRLDAFYRVDTGYLRFVEYNAETPAGIGYGDELMRMFLELEVMKRFQQRYHLHPTAGMPHLLDALLKAYRAWGGKGKPQIAIVDWREVPTKNEHEIINTYFERAGYRSILCDPREMEYRNGALYVGDFRVDMIYKRVLATELVHRMGMQSPIIRAVRDQAVFITNSFSAKLMAKKASLAFLSDEAHSYLFDIDEIAAIQAHIPWTRRVQDRKTVYQGKEVQLLEFTAQNRQNLVLKPNDEYGGAGVVIGWETDQAEWEATLRHALTTPHVVQERVMMVEREFPMMIDGTLDISPRFVDADPYVFSGEYIGSCLTRLSSVALLNVTAGKGSVVPMFIVEPK